MEEGKDGEKVEDEEEKNLSITNWSCPEYVQDEEGRWPLEGTYEFKAELPEGYELAEGVDALVVEVSVAGDQAAVTAGTMIMSVMKNGIQKDIVWDGNNYSVSYNELASMGISLSYAKLQVEGGDITASGTKAWRNDASFVSFFFRRQQRH